MCPLTLTPRELRALGLEVPKPPRAPKRPSGPKAREALEIPDAPVGAPGASALVTLAGRQGDPPGAPWVWPVLGHAEPPDRFAGMNKLETAYAMSVLVPQERTGRILGWWFEGLTFTLAPGARYTPDFLVVLPNGAVRLDEVKGHWREAALVRIRVAAARFPFRFRAIQREKQAEGGRWRVKRF